MRHFRPVSLGIVALLLIALVATLVVPSIGPGPVRAGVDPAPGCTAPSGNLLTTGGFELPDISPETGAAIQPTGWTGGAYVFRNGEAVEGAQYASVVEGSIEQSVSTEGLAGATLTLTLQYRELEPIVTFAGTENQLTGSSEFIPAVRTYEVPTTDAPATVSVRFSGEIDMDAVSIIAVCPMIAPTATATATTQPTVTITPITPIATTAPTATATTQPTAGPAMRATPRPRTTATVPATATSRVPTVRPTPRPRG